MEKKERKQWTEERVRQVVSEEGITNTKELRDKYYGAYKYIDKNGLSFEDFGVEKVRNGTGITIDDVNAVIRENHLMSMRDIKRLSTSMYNWIYNNHQQECLVWPYGRKEYSKFGERKPRVKRYDIWKVMDYLRKYAKEEGISLRDSAVKYGYYYEWYDLVRDGTAPTEE